MSRKFCQSALIGLAVGDALGVPVEFKSRRYLAENPVKDMIGYGTYNLPPGTFSDDTSLSMCLAEVLVNEYNLEKIALNFLKWYDQGYWSARGNVFDIGVTTEKAIQKLKQGQPAQLSGNDEEYSNGNGSLMRTLPLLFFIHDKTIEERYHYTAEVSGITHRHIRSIIACFYYLEFARYILQGKDKQTIYNLLQKEIPSFLQQKQVPNTEISHYDRLLRQNITSFDVDQIRSSAYVVDTLEAVIWCFMQTDTYKEAVLQAVNLGDDTDTIASITGGIAGLYYGLESIPVQWIEQLARKDKIFAIAEQLSNKYNIP
ncbi:MAG: ADP-ribosylglycohydrolase family protein [Bacteroidia bacterium]|nr:ADP-ribosylglycohydrolase family protein [Bacteroidia bacterium]MDW8302171.1 ADP-ribosylglycohydrolase family protein [Bacteroidia bacterium]